MYPIGVNTWVWCSPLTDEWLDELVPRLGLWGFDHVELPLEHPGQWDADRARLLMADHGLEAGAVCAVLGPGRELVAAGTGVVAATQDYLRQTVDAAAAVGARVVGGPLYSSVGRTWKVSPDERSRLYDEAAGNLAPVVAHANACGVRLGIEPLNRFETSVVNTAAQALEIVERVASPDLGVMLDTFHTNIEERDTPAAIRAVGEHLVHMQVCGSDRGAPGGDNILWPRVFDALAAVDYRGALGIESFTGDNETIAVAASIWRPLAPTQDQLATDALAFLHAILSEMYEKGASHDAPSDDTVHRPVG